MVLPVKSAAAGVGEGSGLERLRHGKTPTVESEKLRLHKATKEFESYFMYQMLKTMRQTIPDGSKSESGVLSDGLGKETFTDIFDMEISRKASFGGHNSISEIMYRSMEKLVDVQFEQKSAQTTMKPLKPTVISVPTKLNTEKLIPLTRPSEKTIPLQPVNNTNRPVVSEPISRPEASKPEAYKPAADSIQSRFGHLIDRAARETKLDSALISSVIQAESSGNPHAVSPTGAKGLMQLADSTAQELKVSDPFDPAENIRAGSRYLRRMLDRFGDLKLALAAYNAGPGNVAKYDGVPPFEETRNYVRKITESLDPNSGK